MIKLSMFQEIKLLGELLILHGISAGGLEFDPFLSPLHLSFKIPCVGPHGLKRNLSPHPGGGVGVRIMCLND